MADAESEYLAPGFDPATLTVPRLRAVLVSHSVEYPASAKKAQLVELFSAHVVPQSRRILAARSRTKRTSKGIMDAESSQDSLPAEVDEEAEDALLPSIEETSRPRGPSRRRSKPSLPEPDAPRYAQPERRQSHKHPREPDTDVAVGAESKRPMVRKTRRSSITPAVPERSVPDHVELPVPKSVQEDSVFSDDNPFQSGNSPIGGGERRASSGKWRKSAGPAVLKEGVRRKSTKRRSAVQDGIVVPTAENFEVEVGGGKAELNHEDAMARLEPGEEFTAEEQLDLAAESLKAGVVDVLPPRQAGRTSHAGRWSRSAPWVIMLTLLGGYATWWRREKLAVGYCGIGRPSSALSDPRVPDWATVLQPQCESCPPHAYCYPSLDTICEPNFVLKQHPLSLGGVIPLPPTCEPDGERVRKVKSVADRAVDELRQRRAQYECGELSSGEPAELEEENLKTSVSQRRRKAMSNEEFEELWKGAIGEMVNMDEVATAIDPRTGSRTFSSVSLARLPLSCAVRRSARLAVARYRVELGALIGLVLIFVAAREYIRSLSQARARVPELVKLTHDRLAVQAALHVQDPRAVPEPWISVGQLRDDVLRDEFSPRRREDLWRRVRTVVEMNANVRASVRQGRGGEVSRVWEWIGSVGALEDGSGGRRQGARFSLGGAPSALDSSPLRDVSGVAQPPPDLTVRKWDEGRPIY